MKTLFINRHAKSSWKSPGLSDFDRPLNPRGLGDAPVMAKRLLVKNEKVDMIVSSPANRALTTAKVFADTLKLENDSLVENKEMYGAGTQGLLRIVNGLNDACESVMLFGHNPSFTDFAYYLTGQYISNIPTCGIVKITFDIDSWQEVSRDLGNQLYFDFPKNES